MTVATKQIKAYDVIVAPVITEKSTNVTEHNQVIFKVADTASKPEIKQAVESLFNVKVKAVNTLVRKGKRKVFRGFRGRQGDYKKAVVTLEDGYSIDVATGL
jgi:large subunit ribosomal protein L23